MYISTQSIARKPADAWLATTIRTEEPYAAPAGAPHRDPHRADSSRPNPRRPRPTPRAPGTPLPRGPLPRSTPIAFDRLRSEVAKIAQSEKKLRAQQVATADNARHAAGAMVVAGLVLLLFNSAALTSYMRDLPPSLFTDGLVILADAWNALLESLGVAEIFSPLRNGMEWLRDLRF